VTCSSRPANVLVAVMLPCPSGARLQKSVCVDQLRSRSYSANYTLDEESCK
jgi:hypothetical protein